MLKFIHKILHNAKKYFNYRSIKTRITLLGHSQNIESEAAVLLYMGSVKEDIILKDHCELFGTLISWSHGKITLGEWAKIGYDCQVSCVNSIIIGKDTAIANHVIIVDHNYHPINPSDRKYMRHTPHGSKERSPIYSDNAPIVIGENVMIGNYARICKGVSIGDNSIIGANTIVTKDIPPNCIAVGNPARIVKTGIDKTTKSIFPIKEDI